MGKTTWNPGIPEEPGVYWYDSGFGREEPMLLQIKPNSKYIHGHYGCMPLDHVYHESMGNRVAYAYITEAEDWDDWKCIKGDRERAWVKSPEGYLGFGLLSKGWNSSVGGTIVWLDHPTTASASGFWLRPEDNYQYSLVKVPKIKVKK